MYYCLTTADGLYMTMNGHQPTLTTAKGLARILPSIEQIRLECDLASRILGVTLYVQPFAY